MNGELRRSKNFGNEEDKFFLVSVESEETGHHASEDEKETVGYIDLELGREISRLRLGKYEHLKL